MVKFKKLDTIEIQANTEGFGGVSFTFTPPTVYYRNQAIMEIAGLIEDRTKSEGKKDMIASDLSVSEFEKMKEILKGGNIKIKGIEYEGHEVSDVEGLFNLLNEVADDSILLFIGELFNCYVCQDERVRDIIKK